MTVESGKLPQHIAFIMDGNGRWAKQRGLPRVEGHRAGSKAMQRVVEHAKSLGLKYVTFYAFSTENWKRPPDEVEALMSLMSQYLSDIERRTPHDVRLVILGDPEPLSDTIQQKIISLTRKTEHNTGITVNIAFNYGGRSEIVQAVRQIANKCIDNDMTVQDITEQLISDNLYTTGQPDPDIIVRPSGEYRLSNFLLWQSAYSELVFMDVLWPDFDKNSLEQVLLQYEHRDRRFGGR